MGRTTKDGFRKVYHGAAQIPLDNVERLWQDLESFETNLNQITAKMFRADLSTCKHVPFLCYLSTQFARNLRAVPSQVRRIRACFGWQMESLSQMGRRQSFGD